MEDTDNESLPEKSGAPEAPGAVYRVYQEESDRAEFLIDATVDKMAAFLTIRPKTSNIVLHFPDVIDIIIKANIAFGVIDEAVEAAVGTVSTKRGAVEMLKIAEGEKPTRGKDASIEFFIEPSKKKRAAVKREDGTVDFRELNLISNVGEGDVIGKLRPASAGTPGTTVFNTPVAATTGNDRAIAIDRSVKKDPDGRLVATIAGHLTFEESILSIRATYTVKGDVDYSTGNLDFIGTIEIEGGILDEFSVKAAGDIIVHGAVGASALEAGGDIIISGGVTGRNKGIIKAGGSVRARYLHEVNVEAEGDIDLEKESLNATIKTRGALHVLTGAVMRGSVVALGGIEAAVVGSELGIATTLQAGRDFSVYDRLADIGAQINGFDDSINKIGQKIGPLLARKDRIKAMSTSQKGALMTLVEHLKVLREKREALEGERVKIAEVYSERSRRQINVLKMMYQGTITSVGRYRRILKNDLTGPLTMLEDPENDTIRIISYIPLGGKEQEGDAPTA